MSGPAESVYDVIVLGTGPVGQTVAERAGTFSAERYTV
jgi:pyruvate/2-oxoglutarate dehydrogenase complex dihydrolipoamide dehydrogenase (E3) component